jgi:hypothetical protein
LISAGNTISLELEQELERRFGINHPTLQLECQACPDQGTIVNTDHMHKNKK